MAHTKAEKIRIRWDGTFGALGAYRVSVPTWDGGTVVMEADYDNLKIERDELLEALKAARGANVVCEHDEDRAADHRAHYSIIVAGIDAAIARATGGAQ